MITNWWKKLFFKSKPLDLELEALAIAGTGFMVSLTDLLKVLEERGYTANLVAFHDHFGFDSDRIKLFPQDFELVRRFRLENSSDPDDQAIVYAIAAHQGLKGVYIENYALQEELSPEMMTKLRSKP